MKLFSSLAWFGAGVLSWPAMEYALHGGMFHHGPKDNPGTRDHLDHHRDPTKNDHEGWTYWEGLKGMLPMAVQYATVIDLALTPLLGWRWAALWTGGLFVGFMLYEEVHQSVHRRPPKNAREEKLWKHHLSHHFGHPKKNFGVTATLFDDLFGTTVPVDHIEVPEHLANRWMKADTPEWMTIKARRKPKSRMAEETAA